MNYFIMVLIALAAGALIKPAAKKEEAIAAAGVTNSPGVLNQTVIPAGESVLIDPIIKTAEITETIVTPGVVTGGAEVVGSISGNAEAALAGAKTGEVAEGGLELEMGKVPYAI